jgi:hypothetical protein
MELGTGISFLVTVFGLNALICAMAVLHARYVIRFDIILIKLDVRLRNSPRCLPVRDAFQMAQVSHWLVPSGRPSRLRKRPTFDGSPTYLPCGPNHS